MQPHYRIPLRESTVCDWCNAPDSTECEPECGCGACEAQRALDDQADAYFDQED